MWRSEPPVDFRMGPESLECVRIAVSGFRSGMTAHACIVVVAKWLPKLMGRRTGLCDSLSLGEIMKSWQSDLAKAHLGKPKLPMAPAPLDEYRSKLERAFAQEIELWRIGGAIRKWYYEPEKFKLARACYYTPDFLVVDNDGNLTYYEVKGFWREDAKLKAKMLAYHYPHVRLVAVTRKKGQWEYEAIRGRNYE